MDLQDNKWTNMVNTWMDIEDNKYLIKEDLYEVLEYINTDLVEVEDEKDEEENTGGMRNPTDAYMEFKWGGL